MVELSDTTKTRVIARDYGVEIYIDDIVCFQCGLPFDAKEHKKTKHHAIPKFLKPQINVVVPLGQRCHNKMNIIFSPKLSTYKNQVGMLMRNLEHSHTKTVYRVKRMIENIENLEKTWTPKQ